ncbi:protein inscuteable homolog isoform X2 [Eriocheir sinensis]|uniref:protein inscuteable homolog isoform X2 n=1 Tax=Eriocheir sinensis TaxID=95602 RepID=UPI0021CAB287|nr:protein inscuteable homolog isoform X2 [Eriocheir sinensis]
MASVEGAGLTIGGRRESPASKSPPRLPRPEKEARVGTPFKRSRSRVFYASQADEVSDGGKNVHKELSFSPPCIPTSVETHDAKTTPTSEPALLSRSLHASRSAPTLKDTPTTRSVATFRTTPTRASAVLKLSPAYRSSYRSGKDLRSEACEAPILEEVCSSGEEAGEDEVSPGGSFRDSLRGSPSHRSQDSGYSDSGESTNAHTDSDGSPITPPNLKHITRVYFRDCPEEAKPLSSKTVSPSERPDQQDGSGSVSPTSRSSFRESPASSQHSLCSEKAGDHDELPEELEHKSLLEPVGRHTGAVRKRSTIAPIPAATRRLTQRRSSSTDKLPGELRSDNRRPPPLKARRRWSAADMLQQQKQHQQKQASAPVTDIESCASRGSINGDLSAQSHAVSCGRVGEASPPDALDDPSPTWRLAADPARPHVARKLRIHPTAVALEMRNGSVSHWLKELRTLYEAECMNTLQSKSLPGDLTCHPAPPPPTARHAVRAIQRRAHAVSTEFARLCQRLEWLELTQVPPLAESLVEHINTFLKDYTTQWAAADPDLQPQSSLSRQSKVIRQICERLMEVCTGDHDDLDRDTTRQVVQVVTALGHAFTKLVDLMLSREIRVVVRLLEETREEDVKSSVSHLTALGVDGGHICRLIARLGGVRGLLSVCLEPRLRRVRVAALRALATVCCVVEGIVELEKAGGVEVVAEVLCDAECTEEERSEAAGVLAQITSPWVENTHRLTALDTHLAPIVSALTDLARWTRSAEIFLLAAAAMANLTFLDGGCVEAMRTAGTARVLLRAAHDNPNVSIFTKDQIATVLANLAGSKEAAAEVVEGDGVAVLLALLNTRPAPTHRLPEVATAERVQQKSAIALSRLCREASVARQVAKQGGAERLVQLCKDERERNHSDAVLVACLAALRKMSSSLGEEGLQGIDAAELVEPRLLDSFLIYSSRQESYV